MFSCSQLDNEELALEEELEDTCRFELWNISPKIHKDTFQAAKEPIKRVWCDILRGLVRKYGRKPIVDDNLEPISVTGI